MKHAGLRDEFTVPLCRVHDRDLHRSGDEKKWWEAAKIRPRLPKLDAMGIGRTPAADKARLRAHEISMRFIAFEDRL